MRRLFLCLAATLFACSPTPEKEDPPTIFVSSDGGSGSLDASVGGGGHDAATPDDAGADTVDATTNAPLRRTCLSGCATATDCSADRPGLYECISGICSYVGCLGDDEMCPDGFVCAASETTPYRGDCAAMCDSDADCTEQVSCIDGACRPTGCTSDAQCAAAGNEYTKCADSGGAFPMCVNPCETAADCDADFPADLTCGEEGWCLVAECESDAQCGEWWDWEMPRCVRWDYENRTIQGD